MTQRPTTPPRFLTGVQAVDAALARLIEFLRVPLACKLLYGVQVDGEMPDVPPDTVTVYHGLGRRPIGWFNVGMMEGTTLVVVESDNETITFMSGAFGSVDMPFSLWIY